MKKDRQLVILLAALLVLIFLSSCAAGKNASMTRPLILPTPRTIPKAKKAAAEAAAKEQEP